MLIISSTAGSIYGLSILDNSINWEMIIILMIFSAHARKEQFIDQDKRPGERSEHENV